MRLNTPLPTCTFLGCAFISHELMVHNRFRHSVLNCSQRREWLIHVSQWSESNTKTANKTSWCHPVGYADSEALSKCDNPAGFNRDELHQFGWKKKKDCTLTLENTKPLPTSFLKVGAKGMSLLYVAYVNHLSVNWQLSAIPGWISNLGVNPGSFDTHDHHDWPSVVHSWYEFTQRLVKINEVPEVRAFHLFRQASPLLRPILPGLW